MPGRRIDLHTHSTASDGTTAPDDLVREARAAYSERGFLSGERVGAV